MRLNIRAEANNDSGVHLTETDTEIFSQAIDSEAIIMTKH
jgi:hypothetical protein